MTLRLADLIYAALIDKNLTERQKFEAALKKHLPDAIKKADADVLQNDNEPQEGEEKESKS